MATLSPLLTKAECCRGPESLLLARAVCSESIAPSQDREGLVISSTVHPRLLFPLRAPPLLLPPRLHTKDFQFNVRKILSAIFHELYLFVDSLETKAKVSYSCERSFFLDLIML